MKKIYLFYLYDYQDKINTKTYPAIDGLDIIKGNKYYHVLYAWTPNKNLRKKFKDSRDMSKFKEVVHEIDSDIFDKFSDENSESFLEERLVTTKKIDNNIITKQNIYVLSTRKELDILVYDQLSIKREQFERVLHTDIYLKEDLFNDRYRTMLSFFHFDDIMSYVYPMDEGNIPFSTLTDDTLAVYSHLYYNTYRKDM